MIIKGSGRPTRYENAEQKRLASVTTIISARKYGFEPLQQWSYNCGYEDGKANVPADSKRRMRDAAGAGILAHSMVENQIHGHDPTRGLPEDCPDEMLQQAKQGFAAFLQWQEVVGLVYVETEVPRVSENYQYGGTPDAIARSKEGRLVLCDWKSSSAIYGDHVIQLAAYSQLWNETHGEEITRWYILRFGKEHGDFHFHSFPKEIISMGWRAFVHLRELYELDAQLKKVVK